MSDQLRDRLAGAALGALDPSDSAELAAEVERDPTLAAELHGYRTTVAMLESTVARERPSHDLFAGIWAEIGPQLAGRVEAGPERRWSWRLALPAFTVGAAAAAAVFAIALALDSGSSPGAPDAVAEVAGTPEFAGVRGEARLYGSAQPGGVVRLDLVDVPAAPDGSHYEVWVLRPSAGEAMEAVGVFDSSGSEVELELGLPGAGDYAAVDISLEPDAGPPEHSGTSLAGGTFERPTT
jgi:anti-sigma-K factor RskA